MTTRGDQVEEVQRLPLRLVEVVAEVEVEEMVAVNAERMVISPGIVLVEEEGVEVEMENVSTVAKKVTARVIAQSLKSAGGAARRGTSRMIAQSLKSVSIAAKKATPQVTVQSQKSAGDVARRGT